VTEVALSAIASALFPLASPSLTISASPRANALLHILIAAYIYTVISITGPTPANLKPSVHARICRTTTFFADAALFDMARRFTLHHAE
jgi:hypothetical protein